MIMIRKNLKNRRTIVMVVMVVMVIALQLQKPMLVALKSHIHHLNELKDVLKKVEGVNKDLNDFGKIALSFKFNPSKLNALKSTFEIQLLKYIWFDWYHKMYAEQKAMIQVIDQKFKTDPSTQKYSLLKFKYSWS